jgi:hypothetical protein
MRKLSIIFLFCFLVQKGNAQKDSSSLNSLINAEVDYGVLFDELDLFLDSLLKPRTYTLVNLSAGSNFFEYTNADGKLESKKQILLSPSLGYYSKTGLGISAAANIVKEGSSFTPYQYIASLSYDYLRNINFAGGVAATHYFTKEALNFYTSPLKNEVFGYFTYRTLWFKPSVAASYGWGSKQSIEERKEYIKALRLRKKGRTQIVTTEEEIRDFNLMVSARHDYYWLDIFSNKDFIRITPQINFTSGTQSYGFNQTFTSTRSPGASGKKEIYQSENTNLDGKLKFQPLSVAFALKSEYSIGKFYFQPQAVLNYYIPGKENNLSALFFINTGLFL